MMLAYPETVQHLRAARDLIADPERWCQQDLERDGRYCAVGADLKSRGIPFYDETYNIPQYNKVSPFLKAAAKEILGEPEYAFVWRVNDFLGHAAVMRMYSRAISLAIAAIGEEDAA